MLRTFRAKGTLKKERNLIEKNLWTVKTKIKKLTSKYFIHRVDGRSENFSFYFNFEIYSMGEKVKETFYAD